MRKQTNRNALLGCLLLVLGGWFASPLHGQEQEAENVPPARYESPDVAGVEALALAEELIEYGMTARSAEALVAAARILIDNPVSSEEVPVEEQAGAQADTTDKEDRDLPGLDLEEVLTAASAMAGEDSPLQAVIQDLREAPRARGAVGGPKYGTFVVRALGLNTHRLSFEGGEQGIVAIKGDGDTDLDCRVLDPRGRVVASDTRFIDECVLRFWVQTTQAYRIQVFNLGLVWNEYELLTN